MLQFFVFVLGSLFDWECKAGKDAKSLANNNDAHGRNVFERIFPPRSFLDGASEDLTFVVRFCI